MEHAVGLCKRKASQAPKTLAELWPLWADHGAAGYVCMCNCGCAQASPLRCQQIQDCVHASVLVKGWSLHTWLLTSELCPWWCRRCCCSARSWRWTSPPRGGHLYLLKWSCILQLSKSAWAEPCCFSAAFSFEEGKNNNKACWVCPLVKGCLYHGAWAKQGWDLRHCTELPQAFLKLTFSCLKALVLGGCAVALVPAHHPARVSGTDSCSAERRTRFCSCSSWSISETLLWN